MLGYIFVLTFFLKLCGVIALYTNGFKNQSSEGLCNRTVVLENHASRPQPSMEGFPSYTFTVYKVDLPYCI